MTTYIFPGQGSQIVGMSKDFYDNFDIAKKVFEEIEEYTNLNLKNIIFENNDDLLNQTNLTQISIFTASICIFKTLINETDFDLEEANVMLGHSLGEYTALACSDKLNLKECSQILKKRGELMNEAVTPNQTGMAALIGSNSNNIKNIINNNNINLEIANDNSPLQVVISGDILELEKSKSIFLDNGIKKFVKLNVSSAFHSKYMIEAENLLKENIDSLNFKSNKIKIISNYSASASSENAIIKESLKKQMSNKVRWTESIKKLEEIGETKIVEIGPGKILSGLIKRISNSFDIKSFSSISDMDN